MRLFILIFIIFLSPLAIATTGSVFDYQRIDFFGKKEVGKQPLPRETNQAPETLVDDWAEPIVSPSGKVSVYLPPKEVRAFLENPDQENAKAYLEWNVKRLRKLSLAQEQLSQAATELSYAGGISNLSKRDSRFKAGENYLLYFMLKGCPPCAKQLKIVEDIYRHYPEIKIQGSGNGFSDEEMKKFEFPVSADAGLSEIFKITTYPSIAVFNKKNEKYLLSGYTDKDTILRLFK